MSTPRRDPARTSDCAELSAKFAEAGWAPSDENFEDRPFVKWHGSFFSVAGTPPNGDPCAKSCKTADEVLAFLQSQVGRAEPLQVELETALQQDAAKPDDVELFPKPRPDPMGDALERQRIANARLLHKDDDLNPQAPSDWDMDGQGVVEAMPAVSNVPPEIAALLDDGETLTRDIRRKLTERLNVELAELKNLRGLAGEDLKREAEIEKLLGLFARLGEI
jgi:hypothetical protein